MDEHARFVPEPIASVKDLAQLVEYLQRQLAMISIDLQAGFARHIEFLHVEPVKPFEGLTVGADGSDWDPGLGQGIYTYYGSAWNKLG